MNIKQLLSDKTQAAMIAVGLPADTNTAVTQSTKVEFGDYQIIGALAAAKLLKTNPRALAQQLLDHLDLADIADKVAASAIKAPTLTIIGRVVALREKLEWFNPVGTQQGAGRGG